MSDSIMPVQEFRYTFKFRNGTFTYDYLKFTLRKSLSAGIFGKLRHEEKALYRCALWVAKNRGRLRNVKLIECMSEIIVKLRLTFKAKAIRAGIARAEFLTARLGMNVSSGWASEVFRWVKEEKFVLYLGVLELNEMGRCY